MRCTVCSHPRGTEAEAALQAGGALRAVARDVGIGRSALARHMKKCARAAPPAGELEMELSPGLPDLPAAVALKELAELHRGALESYAGALKDKDRRSVAALLLQLRRNLEVRARLEAQLRPDDRPPAERLAENPEWIAFAKALHRVLDRHPDVKDELRIALEELVAG